MPAGCTSRATAHMNPASSRAIAVQATVSFLPRAANARNRAVRRDCAFRALSRTLGRPRATRARLRFPNRGGGR